MKKILHIISSPRGNASYSVRLGNEIIERLKTAYPGSTVKEKNLADNPYPHLEEIHMVSAFTPEAMRTAENREALKHSDEAIREVMETDVIVIGVPLYNFAIHSGLKAWIDHVVRSGVTFRYDANGVEGLVKGKKVYVAMAAGGVYTEGPMQSYDFAIPYLEKMLGFIGLTDITVYRVEGTSIPGIKEGAWEKAVGALSI